MYLLKKQNQRLKKSIICHTFYKNKHITNRLGFLMNKYTENSMSNIISIFNNKEALNELNEIEFDIQFTSENIPIVIHD